MPVFDCPCPPGGREATRSAGHGLTCSSEEDAQPSGRFFAIPGRRGKPAGVGVSLRTTTSPS